MVINVKYIIIKSDAFFVVVKTELFKIYNKFPYWIKKRDILTWPFMRSKTLGIEKKDDNLNVDE